MGASAAFLAGLASAETTIAASAYIATIAGCTALGIGAVVGGTVYGITELMWTKEGKGSEIVKSIITEL